MAGADIALLLGVVSGLAVAFGRAAPATAFWVRSLLVFAVIVTATYSALPYKTPWNVLPLYAGWVIVAGIGLAEPFERGRSRVGRILLAAALVGLLATLAVQSWRANFRYPADPRNPYAYVHTSPDVVRLAGRVEALSALHPGRENMLVAIVAGPYEQWPLPWYLRRMDRVGYWTSAESAGPARGRAPVIVASSQYAVEVAAALGERYQSEYYGLRPDVIMSVFIERSLWDRYIESVVK
jgi:predicted membrane-bound mannosyltransferase